MTEHVDMRRLIAEQDAEAASEPVRPSAASLSDVDEDTLVKAAREALTRPSDFGYYGGLPLFESWGFVFFQSAASDTVERSNFRTARAALEGRATADGVTRCTDCRTELHESPNAHLWLDSQSGSLCAQAPWGSHRPGDSNQRDRAEDADASLYVQTVGVSHWLVGSADHLAVRVLVNEEGPTEADNLTFTFVHAVELALSLTDYPVLDESDWSELESEGQDAAWGAYLGSDVLDEICEFFGVDYVAELELKPAGTNFDGWHTIEGLCADTNSEAAAPSRSKPRTPTPSASTPN